MIENHLAARPVGKSVSPSGQHFFCGPLDLLALAAGKDGS